MRLFVAIELSEEIRKRLVAIQETLRAHAPRLNWTRAENLHLTLKFLGEVRDADVPRLTEALATVRASAPIEISATHVQCFPPSGRIRIISAGMPRVPALLRLAGDIDDACLAAGFPKEGRPWTPHITIGRAKEPLRPVLRSRLSPAAGQLPSPTMRVDRFVLFSSKLSQASASYAPIASFYINLPKLSTIE
jgi:2'-5' RNA ligase